LYAERHGRHGLLSDRERLPELASTIGREALLVMAADVRRRMPQAFAPGPKGVLRPEDAAFVDAFYAEFLASLERGLGWPAAGVSGEPAGETPSDKKLFRRDLEMYRQWSHRPATAMGAAGAAAAAHANESPFRDRCALLLDPAMMEQARRAAVDFEREILRTAAKRFGQLGRLRVVAARAPRSRRAKVPAHRRARVARRSAKRKLARRSVKKPMRRKPRKTAGLRRRSRA
jgi:hypothetical protein